MARSESCLPSLDRDTSTLTPGEFKTKDSVDSDLKLELTENFSPGTSENKSMDQFLQRRRTDLMYELRNIRHGERPVTGQSHRENIQHFMEKHIVRREDGFKGFDKERNVPANVDRVEKHRPEAVIIEVQGVIDLRPVSSVLQSAAFRRHLENVIRGSFSGRQSVRNVSVNHSSTTSLTPPVTTNSTETTNSTSVIPCTAERQPAEARPQLARQDSSESVCSFSSARSSCEQDIDSDNEEEEEMVLAPEPVVPRYQEPAAAAAAESQGQERGISDQRESPSVSFSWNDISSIQRSEIVEEISELLHGRLVSSTLEGEFRTVLELVAENHLVSTGTNGRAVQDFIHALPRTGVQRNDFSHLGIAPAHENDNWDNVSVTSVSAHSIPYAQTNTYLGREIQSLRSQMNEMKNMLKMSLDLQMDIQRAIRQEVAAAMNSFTEGATGVTSTSPRNTDPISDTHCLICLERHTDTVLYQCGHMCVCFICGRDLVSRGHKCPVCRAPIKDVIRTYRTNAD